ncbi:MAG: hypothetical protein KJO69_10485 [Gammaproteobacteria bacterium]|nr:hypothetical protein [Gammaproteobacteria bacterium]
MSDYQSPITSNSKLSALRIPSKFKLYNHTVKVEDHSLRDAGKYGDWDQDTNTIRLFTNGVCDDVIIHTYYHELAHAMLDVIGRGDLSGDEPLVDQLGGLLAQLHDVTP